MSARYMVTEAKRNNVKTICQQKELVYMINWSRKLDN